MRHRNGHHVYAIAILSLSLSIASVTGCTGAPGSASNDGGPGPGGESLPLDEFADDMARVRCDKLYDCCSEAELQASQQLFFDDREHCLSTTKDGFNEFTVPLIEEAIEAERASYDGEAAAECLARLEGYDCDEYQEALGQDEYHGFLCPEMNVPLVDEGDLCNWNFQCTVGRCVIEDFEAQEGTCRVLPGDGEACFERQTASGPEGMCGDGLDCVEGTCITPGEPGAECSIHDECVTECDYSTMSCAERGSVGDRCSSDTDCKSENCDEDDRCGARLDGACEMA